MKIGIPKALATYEYPILYEKFFDNLGVEVVYSNDTSRDILDNGINYSLSESCLASKVFLGHVDDLVKRQEKENIDYIFVPRLCTFENNQTICVKFFALYDICKNLFPDTRFLTLNIDYEKGENEFKAFIKLGKKLKKKYSSILASYIKARKMQRIYDNTTLEKQIYSLKNNDNKLNILLVSHSYIAYDKYLGIPICNTLKSMNTNVFFSNVNDMNMQNTKVFRTTKKNQKNGYTSISENIYWKSSKLLLNGINNYLDNIDGIVYLSVFPCGTDSLVNEIAIRKVSNIPSINIILDEQDADAGLQTRLESFVDILNMRKEAQLSKVSGD